MSWAITGSAIASIAGTVISGLLAPKGGGGGMPGALSGPKGGASPMQIISAGQNGTVDSSLHNAIGQMASMGGGQDDLLKRLLGG